MGDDGEVELILGDTTALGDDDEVVVPPEGAVVDVEAGGFTSVARKLGRPVNQYHPMGMKKVFPLA